MPLIDAQTADTPPPGNPVTSAPPRARAVQRQQPQKLPPVFYAALIATLGLFVLSLVGLVVIFVALGSSAPEYGLVVVKSEPPGANVLVDGEPIGTSPAQVSIPKEQSFTVLVTLQGYEGPGEQTFTLKEQDLLVLDAVILTKQTKK